MTSFESGLRRLSKTDVFVVIDTMVFLKALGGISPHSEALDCLKRICNRIVSTTGVLREYKCKVTAEGMTTIILFRKIKELERIGKIKDVHRTQLDQAKTLIRTEELPLPTDSFDHKFFEAAIACKARYIITTDPSSLDLNPYCHSSIDMKIVTPEAYVSENC